MGSEWNYGDAYLRHPCDAGTVIFEDGSRLRAHDIFRPLPEFMREADLIFTDSPWNTGNMKSFYTKANEVPPEDRFEAFVARLFRCIFYIHPKTTYLEIGKEYLADYIMEMRKIYKYVTFYNSSYYHRRSNHCYIVRGSDKAARPKLDDIDEEDVISQVIASEGTVIGDLCMGRGLVAMAALSAGKRFVGTELNPKRLSVAVERLHDAGLKYHIEEDQT